MATQAVPAAQLQAASVLTVPVSRRLLPAAVLLLADLLALGLCAAAAVGLRASVMGALGYELYLRAWPMLLLYAVAYGLSGLYPGYGLGEVEVLRRTARATTFVSVAVAAGSFVFKGGHEFSRVVFALLWLLALAVVPLAHLAVRSLLSRCPWWGAPLLVLGAGRTGELLVRKLSGHPGLGLRPVACLDADTARWGNACGGVPVIGPLHMAPELGRIHRIAMAVVAMPGIDRRRLLEVLESHATGFRHVLMIPDLLGVHSMWVTARDLQGVLGLEVQQNLLYRRNRWIKRAMDLALGVPLLLLSTPVILLAALAVRWLSPGPAFYAQEREGLGGRRIRVWKIRTMVPDAEAALQAYLAAHPGARREWETYMKLQHDPRVVPRVGHLLRRYSLDELPQLWNVIRGEMSLVGPRPFPDYHLQRFPESFRLLRRRVLPGITGLWQVSARSEADLTQQEELDTYYIRNWSPWLDIYLLARTVTAVLFGKGAY